MLLLVADRATCSSAGIGIWGINIPVGWGFDIINFVWWIGIGHAGTLISAILLLLRQEWRTSINRFAEAMTLFAVACAGLFPLLHTRPAVARLLAVPVPEHDGHLAALPQPADLGRLRGLDLRHGLAAVLVRRPDPRPRDAARPLAEAASAASSTACWPWAGAARRAHWHRYETAYLLLAGLATPLVLSVHTIVCFDFAVGDRPGLARHDLPAVLRRRRHLLRLRDGADAGHPAPRSSTASRTSSPLQHLENMAKVMLATGLIVAYGYMMEAFMAWYSGNPYEQFMILNRIIGPYAPMYWALILCNVLVAAAALVQEACAPARAAAVRRRDVRQRRHVARALRHHRRQPAPRLPAVVVGHVPARRSGTGRRSSARSACS